MIGASMLWVGWFGFNGGSALAANGQAASAMLVTHLAAATASLTWMIVEWVKFGKPSPIGIVTGMVAGLATVTPASGFIGPMGGIILGVAGGLVCYGAVDLIRGRWKLDDSLDVFAVHGVGGILGSIALPILGQASLGGALKDVVVMESSLVQLLCCPCCCHLDSMCFQRSCSMLFLNLLLYVFQRKMNLKGLILHSMVNAAIMVGR